MTKNSSENAHIRFSTQIIKRLGEELNPSVDQSIIELVKNSYDADATHCTIELIKVGGEGGTVKIVDDGDGMDGNTIKDSYLVLGQSAKSFDKRTRLGRIPAGSKGLGRLAALRMGTIVDLQSKPSSSKTDKFALKIDWDQFDNARLVDDVTIKINRVQSTTAESKGTSVTISNLKQKIGERDIRKVARGLILLSDPFEDDPHAFKPRLKTTEFKELESLVAKRYFDDADYHLSATIEEGGIATANILDYKGNVLFKGNHKDIATKRKGTSYNCPPVSFDLWAFILNSSTFSTRPTSIGEVREWLLEFGGVHFYENGLRVNPYGNQGNDWLDMNLSRARSPEERPSTNTSIGVVRIKDSKGLLKQKTDRSGFIENDVFHEIRSFCQDSLEWMARKRLDVAERKRATEREQTASQSSASKESVQRQISKLRTNDRIELEKVFTTYDKARESEVKSLRAEVQLYRTLSTAGITAATFSHESRGNPIKVLEQAILAIERRGKKNLGERYEEVLLKPIQMVHRAIKSLAVLGTATLKLVANQKRRAKRVNVHEVINNILETFEPFLKGRDISLTTDLAKGNPYLRSTEAAIESIVTNLLNNSVVAIENANPKERRIHIKSEAQEAVLTVTVSDNGTGIVGIALREIWLPGQSTNPNGTGLGLTIVRDSVVDLGGHVRANGKGGLGGADIIVEIPILGI